MTAIEKRNRRKALISEMKKADLLTLIAMIERMKPEPYVFVTYEINNN